MGFRGIKISTTKELLKHNRIFKIIFFKESALFWIKIINIAYEKKKIKGSYIRHKTGNIKNIYIKGIFLEYFNVDKIKNIINPTYKKISFRAKTSDSASGYKRKTGENIAIIVSAFFGVFFIKK